MKFIQWKICLFIIFLSCNKETYFSFNEKKWIEQTSNFVKNQCDRKLTSPLEGFNKKIKEHDILIKVNKIYNAFFTEKNIKYIGIASHIWDKSRFSIQFIDESGHFYYFRISKKNGISFVNWNTDFNLNDWGFGVEKCFSLSDTKNIQNLTIFLKVHKENDFEVKQIRYE